jgi:hypothetical protein
MRRLLGALTLMLTLSGCVTGYTLVAPGTVKIANADLLVQPGTSWNKAGRGPNDPTQLERWTRNGMMLDSLTFVAGLPDGQALLKQRTKEDRQVPVFRANMSPQDLVSMLESYYRVAGNITVFDTLQVEPVTLLGTPSVRVDFAFIGGDEVKRRGRAVLGIVDGKLQAMIYDAAALHYFDASVGEFDTIVSSARRG